MPPRSSRRRSPRALPEDADLLGPAPMFRVRGRHRRRLLIKADDREATVGRGPRRGRGARRRPRPAREVAIARRRRSAVARRRRPPTVHTIERVSEDRTDDQAVDGGEGERSELENEADRAPRSGARPGRQVRRPGAEEQGLAGRPTSAPELRAEVERMIAIMRDGLGVGLAATQLGMLRRLLVFQAGPDSRADGAGQPRDRVALGRARDRRGGLPQPAAGLDGRRAAPAHHASPASTLDGEPVRIEASGLEARVLQHEIDHLDGVLILDHAPRDQRKGALRALREGGSYSPPVDDEDEDAERGASRAAHRRVRTVYLGTSSFAATVLRRLGRHRRTGPQLVVTPPDRPKGRGRRTLPPPVAEAAARARHRAAAGRATSTTTRCSRGSARRAPRRRSSAPSAS